MANNQMTNYIIPTAEDVPPIHVFFEEIPSATADTAQRNWRVAARRACSGNRERNQRRNGVSFHAIPLLPEDLFPAGALQSADEQAVDERHAGHNQVQPERKPCTVQTPPLKRLLDVLREDLHLTEPKKDAAKANADRAPCA